MHAMHNTGTNSPYPVLRKGIESGLVVMFTKHSTGTVVVPTAANALGRFSTCWDDDGFVDLDLHEEIILKNS